MINLTKAIDYVRTSGSVVENARLNSILWNTPPDKKTKALIKKMQKSDGSFAYWIKEAPNGFICDTVHMLLWFDDLRIHHDPIISKAVNFLFTHQSDDGGWNELDHVVKYNAPEYLIPGKVENQVWITANCAHWLLLFGYAESPQYRGCPVDFLLKHRTKDGRQTGYLRATWDCIPIYRTYANKDERAFDLAFKATRNSYSPNDWEGSYIAWLIRCLRDAHIPLTNPFVKNCLGDLQDKQRQDGSWSSEDSEEYSTGATLEALRVLKDYELI